MVIVPERKKKGKSELLSRKIFSHLSPASTSSFPSFPFLFLLLPFIFPRVYYYCHPLHLSCLHTYISAISTASGLWHGKKKSPSTSHLLVLCALPFNFSFSLLFFLFSAPFRLTRLIPIFSLCLD
ncbi:hypothetical protein HOY80DRAFT_987815 [Tuber brumale]|nr:hypothetical protein HOY80DRAFT_987815 [Tuber brumale]